MCIRDRPSKLSSATEHYRANYRALPSATERYRVLPSATERYRALPVSYTHLRAHETRRHL
eukprot:11468817-Prorocentrum_lima.AAC.1